MYSSTVGSMKRSLRSMDRLCSSLSTCRIPQTSFLATNFFHRGKVLGGSSAINGMQWTRGTLDQYDTFQRLGNPGWNSNSLFQYMKKSEKFHAPNPAQVASGATYDPSVHGQSGPIDAGYPNPPKSTYTFNSMLQSVVNYFATVSSGPNARGPVQKIIDVCSGAPRGVSRFFFSIIPGTNSTPNKRASSAQGYIYPYVNPSGSSLSAKNNLVVLVGHQATKILWKPRVSNSANAVASGVQFIATPIVDVSAAASGSLNIGLPVKKAKRDATTFTVNLNANKGEVIVSSGALGVSHHIIIYGSSTDFIHRALPSWNSVESETLRKSSLPS